MVSFNNLYNNANMIQVASKGPVKVFEHQKDLSVESSNAINAYFASKMNLRKRQVLIELNGNSFCTQAGAMQWIAGNVTMGSGIKGVGDFLGKAFASAVTKESASKPEYSGNGLVMLEPTYKHILLEDIGEWGSIVLDDGLFLACDTALTKKVVARSNLSSAALGKEGLFNLSLSGNGIAVLESPVARE